MKQRTLIIIAIIAAAFFGAVSANLVSAQQSHPQPASEFDRAAIEQIVRDTIRDDPSIIVDALNEFSENHAKNLVRKFLPDLLSDESGFIAGKGADGAKVAVIEFFDYHCGFCKRSADFVQDLIEKEKGVKIALRELPILREESEIASRYALAARRQGKYQAFHFALLREQGVIDEKRLAEVAAKVGLDVERLKKDQSDPAITAIINKDRQAAREMAIDGTPTFIIASVDGEYIEVVPGYKPDMVKAAIAEARKSAGR